MSLPPIGCARLVVLGNPEVSLDPPYKPAGATELPTTVGLYDFIDTNGHPGAVTPPQQDPFYSSQIWYSEYPVECVIAVPSYFSYAGNLVVLHKMNPVAVESTYPTDIVYSYNPGSPDYDPVPDPNGNTGGLSTSINPGLQGHAVYPRWYDADPYEMAQASSYDFWMNNGYFPEKNYAYPIYPNGSILRHCSVDLTANNLDSKVYNQVTLAYEYYPFNQTTFHYKQTAKLVIPASQDLYSPVCCWNDGTVIEGGVTFSSINVTVEPLGDSSPPGYGFVGMTATTGENITEETSTSFSVTISTSYTPVEIEIPAIAGKITFVSDFWITSVTPPT